MTVDDDKRRELVVEEVAEAEVALADLSIYGDDDLAAMNERLAKLRNEAIGLSLPTTKIDQLKLRVASAIGGGPKRGPGPRKGHGLRSQPRQAPQDTGTAERRTQAVKDLFGGKGL